MLRRLLCLFGIHLLTAKWRRPCRGVLVRSCACHCKAVFKEEPAKPAKLSTHPADLILDRGV